ncbi:unnamed protein product [Prorocentrum cordatum]|uniref:Uncharacterized protein n=1 Tax=Prorocentrum cordatum TaxID=2364126 RepID=A0ABN9URS3_9DINO|nr:unnamed protein product [Polarella glacialis]
MEPIPPPNPNFGSSGWLGVVWQVVSEARGLRVGAVRGRPGRAPDRRAAGPAGRAHITWAREACVHLSLLEEGSPSAPAGSATSGSTSGPPCSREAPLSSRGSRPMPSALPRLDLTPPSDCQGHGRGVVRSVLRDLLLGQRARPGPRKLSSCGTPPAIAQAASRSRLAASLWQAARRGPARRAARRSSRTLLSAARLRPRRAASAGGEVVARCS